MNNINHKIANNILRNMRNNGLWETSSQYCDELLKIFPNSINIKDEAFLSAFYCKKYIKANKIINDLIELKPDENIIDRIMRNKLYCIQYLIQNNLNKLYSNLENFKYLENSSPYILIFANSSIETIKSFLFNCKDKYLFSSFYYIYNNENELNLKELPKYFKCIFSLENNISKIINLFNEFNYKISPYIFFIKKNWLFFDKKNYITTMRDILDSNENDKNYGQVLFNQNTNSKISIDSIKNIINDNSIKNYKYTNSKIRFLELNYENFYNNLPSLINSNILYEHNFENKYSNLYKTALLDGIHCIYDDNNV